MGLFSFLKNAGAKVFKSKKPEVAATEEEKTLQAQELFDFVKQMGFDVTGLRVRVEGENVTLGGEVPTQEEKEKIILAIGNVEGVGAVDDNLVVKVETHFLKFQKKCMQMQICITKFLKQTNQC